VSRHCRPLPAVCVPAQVELLVQRAGLRILKRSTARAGVSNVYYNRDFLVVLGRADDDEAAAVGAVAAAADAMARERSTSPSRQGSS
jgi:hypothetical protein